jgi:hypothetical protein
MKLTIRNDLGQEFEMNCREFIGYDVFIEARENWGYNWNTYMVLDGVEILESVLNPNTLDPTTAQRIH